MYYLVNWNGLAWFLLPQFLPFVLLGVIAGAFLFVFLVGEWARRRDLKSHA